MYLIHDHPSLETIDHFSGSEIVDIGVACSEGIAVVSVAGELDMSNTPWLYECLHDAIDAGVTQLVVDIEHLTLLDSTALSVLAGANRRLSAAGGTLTVMSPLPAIRELLGAHLVPEPDFNGAA
jgi:anti-anti-sigma factor